MYVACIHVYTPQHVDSGQVGSSGSPKFDTSVLCVCVYIYMYICIYTSVQDCVLGLQELQNWGASCTKS